MWNIEKVKNIINNEKKLQPILKTEKYFFNFIINGKPENYVRERSGRGSHFYNPKQKIINENKIIMKKQLTSEEQTIINSYISDEDYYVSLDCKFYLPIPKNDSNKIAALKESKQILPNKRPDEDNYEKLLLDSLHDVIYDDDCKVVSINSAKYYSITPRTEISVIITKIIKE